MRRERVLIIAGPAEGGIRRHLEHLTGSAVGKRLDFVVIGPGRLPSPATVAGRLKPDQSGWPVSLINAHGYRAGLVALAGRFLSRAGGRVGPPILLTMHGFPPRGPAGWLCRLIVRRAEAVIAVSSALAERAELMGAKNVRVVPNGVDLAAFGGGERSRARRTGRTDGGGAGRPGGPVVIGVLARLAREKGVGVVIRAVARLIAEGTSDGRGPGSAGVPGLCVLIAGDGPQRRRLEALVRRLGLGGLVRFLGRVDDVPAFLAGIDILAAPSLREGQSLAVMEAMAAGRPVIASAVGGLVELVDHGRNGLLVAPGDAIGLAEAIRTLAGDSGRRAAMGRAGRVAARSRFALRPAVEQSVRVMEGVIARGAPGPADVRGRSTVLRWLRSWWVHLVAVTVILIVLFEGWAAKSGSGGQLLAPAGAGQGVFVVTVDHTDLADWRRPGLSALPGVAARGALALMNSRTGANPGSGDQGDTEESPYVTLGAGTRAVAGGEEDVRSVAARNAALNRAVPVGLLGQALRSSGILTAVAAAVGQSEPSAHSLQVCMDRCGAVDVRTNLAELPRLLSEWRAAGRRYLVVVDCPEGPGGLVQADATIGRVLELAGDDSVVVVSPSPSPSDEAVGRELVPAACVAGGRSKTMTSPTTRKVGLVANIDLAPTLLSAFGLDSTGAATGRGLLAAQGPSGWLDWVERLGEQQGRLQNERPLLVRAYIAAQVLSWLAALAFLWGPATWQRRRVPSMVVIGLLTIGLYPPVSLVLGLLGPHGPAFDAVFGLAVSVTVAAAVSRAAGGAGLRGVVWAGGLASAVATADVLLGGPMAWRSPIGYSLVSGARYYGIGNESMGVLVGSSLVALAGRAQLDGAGRIDRAGLVLVGLAVALTVGAPWTGANLGGAMTAAAGYAYLAMTARPAAVGGGSPTTRRCPVVLLGAAVGSAVLLVAFAAVAVDAARPGDVQSHLGVLADAIRRDGPSAIAPVLLRKLAMNLRLIRYTLWSRILLGSFAAYVILLFRPRGMVGRVLRAKPGLRHGLSAASVAAVVALVANDSGVVAAGMLMIYPGVALLAALLEGSDCRSGPTERSDKHSCNGVRKRLP